MKNLVRIILKLSIPCIFRIVDRNRICNIRTKFIYTVKYMHFYHRSPTYFAAYCAIFWENFIVCSELLLFGFEHTIKFPPEDSTISAEICRTALFVCLFVCLFPWASAASHGCTAARWLIVPPALDFPTLATKMPPRLPIRSTL
jgi:hypothetical protein